MQSRWKAIGNFSGTGPGSCILGTLLCVCTKTHVCELFSCRKWEEFKGPTGNVVGYIACSYK